VKIISIILGDRIHDTDLHHYLQQGVQTVTRTQMSEKKYLLPLNTYDIGDFHLHHPIFSGVLETGFALTCQVKLFSV
jgi:hypothetical protein